MQDVGPVDEEAAGRPHDGKLAVGQLPEVEVERVYGTSLPRS